jgi:hypothetical protein
MLRKHKSFSEVGLVFLGLFERNEKKKGGDYGLFLKKAGTPGTPGTPFKLPNKNRDLFHNMRTTKGVPPSRFRWNTPEQKGQNVPPFHLFLRF